jgi:hypothetical protein
MIHGTPVPVLMAILAAQSMYLVPFSLNAASMCWYSFSILFKHKHFITEARMINILSSGHRNVIGREIQGNVVPVPE